MSDTLQIERVDATAWRDACSSAARDGWRFSSLHAAAGEVRALFVRAADQRLLTCTAHPDAAGNPAVPTLVDLFAAAGWDEREAHDLHGISFAGQMLIPIYLVRACGLSPSRTGWLLAPLAAARCRHAP